MRRMGERLALANRTAQKEFCLCSWKPAHISAFFHPPQEANFSNLMDSVISLGRTVVVTASFFPQSDLGRIQRRLPTVPIPFITHRVRELKLLPRRATDTLKLKSFSDKKEKCRDTKMYLCLFALNE